MITGCRRIYELKEEKLVYDMCLEAPSARDVSLRYLRIEGGDYVHHLHCEMEKVE